MKKQLFTIALFLLASSAFAQKTYLDILANYSPSTFYYGNSNSELKDYRENLKGIQAGLSFQAGITENFTLVSELYYMQKGSKLKADNPVNGVKTKTRLHLIEMPVLARLHLGKFYLNAGPSIAYQTGGKVTLSPTETSPETKTKIQFGNGDDEYKRWDAGVEFGGGYELPFKKTMRVTFDVRYHVGLVNISNVSEVYNRSLLFNVMISKPWKTNPFAKK